MATVVITGGTGLIGSAITKHLLVKGYKVIILTRSPEKYRVSPGLSYAKWNIQEQIIAPHAISEADYIIHLAGAGVAAKRWTSKRKKEIVESRTKSSALIVKALRETPNKVQAVVSASAIGWYGEGEDRSKPFVETDVAASDFLGSTCKEWEASIEPVVSLGKRLVIFRTGIVMSNEGGALKEFKKPLHFGVAGILGSGKQVISWIHIDDLVRLYTRAIENNKMVGIYNAVSPHPVTNKNLTLQLAKRVRGKFYVPVFVPAFILKLILGEMSVEVLKSAVVSCCKIEREGYVFLYPSFKSVLQQME